MTNQMRKGFLIEKDMIEEILTVLEFAKLGIEQSNKQDGYKWLGFIEELEKELKEDT